MKSRRSKVIVLAKDQPLSELINQARELGFLPDLVVCLPGVAVEAERLANSIGSELYQSRFFDRLKCLPEKSHLPALANLVAGISRRQTGRTAAIVWVILKGDEIGNFIKILNCFSLVTDTSIELAFAS